MGSMTELVSVSWAGSQVLRTEAWDLGDGKCNIPCKWEWTAMLACSPSDTGWIHINPELQAAVDAGSPFLPLLSCIHSFPFLHQNWCLFDFM